ncbi:MAG: hemerythrin domain-containing protein [Microthrixaceae bacterium]|nr:hemerythrin domain-containing protein [Microthrixaceae bacterium]
MCDHCGCREFTPVAELTAEHDVILDLAWALAESIRSGVEDQPVKQRLLALLDAHVAKEETGLYPMLYDLGELSDVALRTLEAEHDDIHMTISEGRFGRREYYELSAHIEVEDAELFSSGRFVFDQDDWDALQAIHDRVDTPSLDPVGG